MAAPAYYDNTTNTILDGTIASASDVENKCDDIATSFADVAEDVDNCLRFTNADFTDQTSGANASTRANKVVGFSSTGALELKSGLDTYVTAAQTAQTAAEAAQDAAEIAATTAVNAAAGVAELSAIWAIKSDTYTAVAGDHLVIDTTAGGVTITLPASPSVGQYVKVKTTKYALTYPATIGRNGSNINGTAEDLVVDVNYFEATLVYTGATLGWSM